MTADQSQHRNALAGETSPYLLQHAANPVDWYPWNETALARAREEGKPILLSIGYSACHWCHVMAHESFEDEETAAIMNEHFINIKVDREERPDLDRIYQIAQQMLTQRNGGWPLTMFLTHDDHLPFFGGTYFPRESRYGLPGFKEVLHRIAEFYQTEQEAIRRQNASLQQAFASMQQTTPVDAGNFNAQPLTLALQQLEENYDSRCGGFGAAPKFPHPTHIEGLLRHWTLENHRPASTWRCNTLRNMAEGGIYDHIGGGFCRYSVDQEWMIPHFEKMLYDNGPLLALYAEAWQITGEDQFRRVCEETAAWVMREMQSPEGGFYSSLDADSEGEEGKYYIWTPAAVRAALADHPQAELLERLVTEHYGLDQPPNFEGHWHLRIHKPLGEIAAELGRSEDDVRQLLDTARQRLFEVRERRVRPGRDDKLLTSWNALMIKGLAVAGRILKRDDWVDAAGRALDCIKRHLWQDDRLLATYKDGRAHLNAYLDDYAFLIHAIGALLEARWRRADLDFTIELAEVLLTHYRDPQGGFFFTADDHEQLIQRSKPLMDDSLPNGNGIAAFALQRLGHLLGEPRYLDAATGTLQAAWPGVERLPFAHGALLLALEEHLYPPQLVIIRGNQAPIADWLAITRAGYRPRRLAIAIPTDETGLPGALAGMTAKNGGPAAYVCTGTSCSAPVETPQALETALGQPESGPAGR
ncbi:MAG: thioredoxin domain-containing protein [Gammaproteobacteria bacterium]|nr:thioredoxin domain-containing protein [Gammaproteobacteria bacterium]